jgi:hypothetical protein
MTQWILLLFYVFKYFNFCKLYVLLVTFIFSNHRVFNNEMPSVIPPLEYL